jgi:hypothetical protein
MTEKMIFSKSNPVWIIMAGLAISLNITAQQDTARVLSQYLFPGFSNGTVRFKTGPARDAMMNYNMLSEKMVFEKGGKYFDLVSTETIDTVYLRNRKFIPSDKVFLEVVLSGKIPFFIQHRADLMSPGKQAGYGGTSQTSATTSITTLQTTGGIYNLKLPDDYTVKASPIYWILVKGNMGKFLNERQFLKILRENQIEIKKFIKENKISFDKRDDLIRLITYCQWL